MTVNRQYSLAYSPCPNDTFIFKAMAQGYIDLRGMAFNIVLDDVETLNQKAVRCTFDVTKLSFSALGALLDRYALLRSGAALGRGCGPLVVSRPGWELGDRSGNRATVAVPGMGTTAYQLFRFFMADRFPHLEMTILPLPFDNIMAAVISKEADVGLLIHEGRFVYETRGLEMKADLGQWWEEKTDLPIPLGCIAVRRDMDPADVCEIQDMIRESIDHAVAHPDQGATYIREHAREMDPAVIAQHIGLYVNDFSRDLGEEGEEAVTAFFAYSRKTGLMTDSDLPLFAC